MAGLKSVCVFCGANFGRREAYASAARSFGRLVAERGLTLVYGGAKVGLMGELADAALESGGEVVGVLPRALMEREIGHPGITRLEVVNDMHTRKARLAELSDAFIALPGGIGTMEEVFEVWTWGQLGFHKKPVGFLNVAGYYDSLAAFLAHAVSEAFLQQAHRDMLIVRTDGEDMLSALDDYVPPTVEKWIGRAQL
ncbi:TIGR00730 family Rossman fold protein [Phenylobacterium sp.]|uniref:LOG family protein n=1 Tax=Phenylobacterium sp. TaxID=1871053 RepID=UPI0035ADB70E